MDQPFLNSLIPASVNLVAMVLIYSLLANALVRFHWRGRGAVTVIALIIIAGLFWIVPFSLTLGGSSVSPRALWFGNWLVSGCSVVILCQRVRWIPRELGDLARLHGCGWFGTYQHITLPLVRRELGFVALLTGMTTGLAFWVASAAGEFPPSRDFPPWLELMLQIGGSNARSPAGAWLTMIAGSLVMTLPVILIFFLAKRYLEEPSIRLGEAKPNCPASE